MTRAHGIHHLAICTADIKPQIEFFSDVLGMELVALYWMHGVEGAWHGFLRLNDLSSIAFVQTEAVKGIDSRIGETHAGNPGLPSAPGTMQHLALRATDRDELIALRDRIRSRGINVFGPIDHGFCQSIYFAGPENLSLEVSTSAEAIDPDAWIDPEVVALAGIDAEELQSYRNPPAYEPGKDLLNQPQMDPAKPHMYYPARVYERLLATSDADYTRNFSETEPPVSPGG